MYFVVIDGTNLTYCDCSDYNRARLTERGSSESHRLKTGREIRKEREPYRLIILKPGSNYQRPSLNNPRYSRQFAEHFALFAYFAAGFVFLSPRAISRFASPDQPSLSTLLSITHVCAVKCLLYNEQNKSQVKP
jgi:hypothetical protein